MAERRFSLLKSASVAVLVAAGLAVPAFDRPADAAPAAPPDCKIEQPTEQLAGRTAAACRQRVEILSERSEVSQTFANGDGSQTLEVGIEPQRVRKGANWVPVDTRLKATAAGLEPRSTVLPVTFSAGGTGPFARLRDGAKEIALSWPGTLPKPVIAGDTAVYPNVLPDVDLKVTAQALGFSEVLVVKSRAATKNPKLADLKFGLATKGVNVGAEATGGLAARDAKGAAVFTAPAPLMWDSTVDTAQARDPEKVPDPAQKPAADSPVRKSVMKVRASRTQLTLTPDTRMLADPAAKLPLYIDPSWTGSISAGAWTTVWSKFKTSSFWKDASAMNNGKVNGSAGAGRTEDCSGCADYIVRSFFRMDTSKVRGKQIVSAQFRIEQRHSWTCSPKSNAKLWLTGGISDKTTWNNQPTWNSSYTVQTAANRKNGAIHGCSGPGTIEFNTTSMVAKAAASNWSTMTLGLRAVDEGTLNQWKRFNHASPKLAITYNTIPNGLSDRKSDGKACATGASRPYVYNATPILAAKHSDPDADQQNLTTYFYWWQLGSSRNETNKISKGSGNPSSITATVPSGKLTDGATYVWQARTYDGRAYGAWSGTCEFTVDATPPPTPADINSGDYSDDNAFHGGVGVIGTFDVVAPAVRPYEVKEYAWTLDSGVLTTARNVPARTTGDYGAQIKLPPLHDGANVLRVWARDASGRYSATPRTHTFLVRAGDGPAAEWNFDEDSGDATDTTTHGNTTTLSGTTARVAGRGGQGYALNLTGSGAAGRTTSVTYPNPDTGAAVAVATDSTYTVTARAKIDTLGGTGKPTIVAANGTRTSAFTLVYSREDNRWRFTVAGTDADNPALYSVLSNAAPTAGKWTHLAAVYNASTKVISLYVDGVLQTATATVTSTFNATGGVSIGKRKWNGGDSDFFVGAIDDVRVYSFAETAARIAGLAVPLQAAVAFPDGNVAQAGGTLNVTLGGGGDINVTKFRWSVDSAALDHESAVTAGGSVTVPVPVGSTTGDRLVYVAAVDSGNRVGPATQFTFSVDSAVSIAGVVLDATTFLPVDGAAVTLDPGGRSTTTGDDGSYRFADFSAGTYTLRATKGGKCGLSGSAEVDITDGATSWDIYVFPYTDDLGYTCTETTSALSSASTALSLTGDDAVAKVALPFEFPFYGVAYSDAWVDTNGVIAFDDPAGSHPAHDVPAATVAPFWDDLVADGSSTIKTATTGTGDTAKFTVQWQNVYLKASSSQRISFEATIAATGGVSFAYDSLDNDAEKGSGAEVGIEAPDGADGLPYSVDQPTLATGKAVVFNKPAAVDDLDQYSLSGRVLNAAGTAVAGIPVTLDPSGKTVTSAADGSWRFTDLVADSYTATATGSGRCPLIANQQVELAADTAVDLRLAADYGSMGYACTLGTASFQAGTTLLTGVTGDDASVQTTFPFPVNFHGLTYSAGWISTNGMVGFGSVQTGTRLASNPSMPSTVLPNAVVAPLWDDLEIDASAGVYTLTTGTAPNRTYVIEWRNAIFRPAGPSRVTFEVKFAENGQISFHYGTLTTPLQQGGAATVGLESASGTIANQYSYAVAALTSNSSITYTPAPTGAVKGTVTVAVTGAPAAGVPVTLNPGNKSTTTAADGTYSFAALPVGEYTVAASTGDTRCAGQSARESVARGNGDLSVDLSVMSEGDEFGYKCNSGPVTFVPGDITEGWNGDEVTWQKNPPFPVKLYGESYTSAWINSNGLIAFKDPAFFGWIGSTPETLPTPSSEGKPDAAVYAFWDDWIVDPATSKIATKTSGTAPNRQWIVEWRNVYLFGDTNARASFEVIFQENGQIQLAYADLSTTNPLERGSGATVGIENASGTIAYQYSSQEAVLTSGQGVTYKPNPPGQGGISGTVTCGGTAVSGATVAVAGLTATTGTTGGYSVASIPGGNYAVIATVPSGNCKGSSVAQTIVGTSTQGVVDFPLVNTPAGAGYTIAEQPVTYTAANTTVLPITGDEAYGSVALPFPVTHYGHTSSTAWVDSNGLLAFTDPGEPSSDAWPIPSVRNPEEPNDAIYPFWHDWVVDSSASVRTATRGTAPNRQFVVEWRNVASYESPTTRMTFQAILDEAGGYSFAYADSDGTFLERGGGATIGIENADGTVALQYTYRQPVLRPGLGIRINKPTS